MQKSFLDRPLAIASTKQQDQSADLIKMQKEINKFMIAEKRSNGKKKINVNPSTSTNYNNMNISNLTTSTPEK